MISTLLELFWSCTKIGLLAFGGGNAAIPLLESEAVPRWISEQEFGELVGINFQWSAKKLESGILTYERVS